MKKQEKTSTNRNAAHAKAARSLDPRAKYAKRPDGLTNGTEDVFDNLAQNAWFPALYADEILMDDFPDVGQ